MASKDFILNIIADVADYQAELQKVPGMTEKSAAAAATAFAKQQAKGYEAAQKSAKKAAEASAKAFKDGAKDSAAAIGKIDDKAKNLGESLENIGKGLGYGGPLGDLKDFAAGIAGLGPAVGGTVIAIGAATLAVTGLGLAAAGAATAMVSLNNYAADLLETSAELVDLPGFEPIDPLAVAAIQDADRSMEALSRMFQRTALIIAGELAPYLEKAAFEMVRLALWVDKALTQFANLNDGVRIFVAKTMSGLVDVLLNGATATGLLIRAFDALIERVTGTSPIDTYKDTIEANTLALIDAAGATFEFAKMTGISDEEVRKAIGSLQTKTQATKADTQATQDAARAERELLAAQEAQRKQHEALGDRLVKAAQDEQKEKTDAYKAAQEEQARLLAQQLKDEEEAAKKKKAMINDMINSSFNVIGMISTALNDATTRGLEDIRQKRSDVLAQQEKEIEGMEKAREDALLQGNDKEAALLQKKIAASKNAHNKELAQIDAEEAKKKKAAQAAYAISKALALAQIAISTAKGIVEAVASQNYAGAVIMGITGAVQAGVVAATPPPKFHSGGYIGGGRMNPDEVDIRAKTGEFVVSTQGVRAAGGPDNLARLNRGEPMGSGPLVIQNVYGHRVFEAFVQDNLKMNGRLSRAVRYGRDSGRVTSRTKKAV